MPGLRPTLLALIAVMIGLGSLWVLWLATEVAAPPAQAGHHDFFALYAAGSLVRAHHAASLYSVHALTAVERHILDAPVGAAGYMPFLNPPQAAALLSPLSLLAEPAARLVWLVLNVAVAVACVLVATESLSWRLRALAAVLLLTSFPAYQAFVEGQWSFVLLLGCLAGLVFARRGRPLLAGAALAVLWLKPPLLVLVLVWLLLTRRWRIAASALGAVALVTLLLLPWTGAQSNSAYLTFLGGVTASHAAGAGAGGATPWEGGLPQMEGLIGLAATVAGQQHAAVVDALTLAGSAAIAVFFVVSMRERWAAAPAGTRHGVAAVCCGLLLDPHLYAQDCVLLVVGAALLLRAARSEAAQIAVVAGCTALMDLAAVDTLWTPGMPLWPLHLLTLALVVITVMLARPRRPSARADIRELQVAVRPAG